MHFIEVCAGAGGLSTGFMRVRQRVQHTQGVSLLTQHT